MIVNYRIKFLNEKGKIEIIELNKKELIEFYQDKEKLSKIQIIEVKKL